MIYNVFDLKKSKQKKGIPYIKKREFKKLENTKIVGMTKLKEVDVGKYDRVDEDLIYHNENYYFVKDKYYGRKKGYIYVGNNKYIILKSLVPFFLFLFFLFVLLLILLFFNKTPKEETIPEVIIPEIITPVVDETEEPIKEETKKITIKKKTTKKKETVKVENKYLFEFNSNGAEGNMDSIIFKDTEEIKLPKNLFEKIGYTFLGWSLTPDGEAIYQDEVTIDKSNIEPNKNITLYAIWEINKYLIGFYDYDDSLILEKFLNYGEKISNPDNPIRLGYTFQGWDNKESIVEKDLIIKAKYNKDEYKIEYELNNGILENIINKYDVETETFTIPKPTKEGYTFIGWSTLNDTKLNLDYEVKKGSIGDIELIANYEANIYEIKFDSNGGTPIDNLKVVYDSTIKNFPDTKKIGYTFQGWEDSKSNKIEDNYTYTFSENIELYAIWEINKYNISYNLNGGKLDNKVENYTIETETFSIPNPTKEGYTFIGWTTSNITEPQKEFKIEKGNVGDIELIANYEANSYFIKYDNNGGKGNSYQQEFIYNKSQKLIKNTFELEGYDFIGWSLTSDGTAIYQDEQEILNLTSDKNKVIIFYAQWKIKTFTVEYYDWNNYLLDSELVDYGGTITPPAEPNRDGYTFKGWTPSDNIIKSNSQFFTQYDLNKYMITYDLNRQQENDINTINFTIESDDIILVAPSREGYTFLGWTGSNGRKSELEIIIPKGSVNDKNYTANWIANSYVISLNPNGGELSTKEIKTVYNSVYGIIPEPVREGYTFEGWHYNNEKILDSTVLTKAYNHELIAQWKVINYNISYNLNGGNVSTLPDIYNIETNTINIPNPTKEGYTFLGWTGSNGSTPQKNISIPKGSIGNKSYTANWEVINYSISYNLNGGSASNKTSYNVETNTFTLASPNRTGYIFLGWTGSNGSTPQKNISIPKGSIGNKSYTANWEVINYSISYNLNGGSASNKTSYNVETNTFTLTSPSRTGYTFLGWTGSNGSTPQKNISISKGSIGDKSYTANWQINTYEVDINPIIQNTSYNSGLNGFTFSVWINGSLVADHVTDYYTNSITYGSTIRVYVYDREGYSVTSFRDKTWTVTSSFNINPTWYDNIAPTIISFNVTNLGLFDPERGEKAGWNIYITIDAYDNGTGMQKFQTWLTPFGEGSGAPRVDGQQRTITNVLYMNTPSGRTFCAYAIDNAGNEAERCATIKV